MLERERSFDLVHMCERMWKWMYITEIVIHHSFFGLKKLTSSNGFPTEMSQHTMVSDKVRFVFFELEKKSDSLSIIADSNEDANVFHNFSS